MKNKLPIIGIVLILLAGIGVLSYPLVSSVVNNIASRQGAEDYSQTVKVMPDEETKKYFEEAEKYNASLNDSVIITDPFDYEAYSKIGANYEDTLMFRSDGVMGYIDVPKINVYLPIYHGTSKEILDKGAGHLQNTSLPIGGMSTHSVISAHSAYPTETFFDYLTDLKDGDEFYVHILNRTLKYKVDQIKVVLPENIEDLRVINGKDYVTLLTCTPYSINTHRLLVRGERVEYDDSEYVTTGSSVIAFEDYLFLLGYKIPYWGAGLFILGVVLVIVLIVVGVKRSDKNKKQKHIKSESDSGGAE